MRIEKRAAKKAKNGVTYRVKIDYEDEYGVKQTYSKGGFATKKEARIHGEEMDYKLRNGLYKKESNKTLAECFLEAMELEKDKLARSTVLHYMGVFNTHILPDPISHTPISRLKYPTLQKYFNTQSDKSKTIVNSQKCIFNRAFKHALKSGYITENCMHDVDVSYKKSAKENHVLTPEELDQVIDCILSARNTNKKYAYCIITYCGYYLGLRLTEILALEKTDFDFDEGVVYISKKMESQGLKKDELYITENMKTRASRAVLPIPAPLKVILLNWFAFNPYDLVCCDLNGDPIRTFAYWDKCKRVGQKLGFDFHPHCLRHTYITNIVRSGCDIKTAAKLARHNDVQTTLNVYAHSNETAKKEAVENAFGNSCPKNDPKISFIN